MPWYICYMPPVMVGGQNDQDAAARGLACAARGNVVVRQLITHRDTPDKPCGSLAQGTSPHVDLSKVFTLEQTTKIREDLKR